MAANDSISIDIKYSRSVAFRSQGNLGAADCGEHRQVAGAWRDPAASAQTDKPGLLGYSNAARTDQEKKNDRELDRAYESTVKERPDAKQNSDPWADVRSAPPAAVKNKQK